MTRPGPTILAFTAFKETLSPREACEAVADLVPDPLLLPVADGGDGTLDVFPGRWRRATVTGPLGVPVRARYRLDGRTAVLEMAQASGLKLVPKPRRNPMKTTTRGTGDLILAARRAGATRILLGVGGSATVDGGAGALELIEDARDVTVLCDVETRLLDAPRVFGPQKGATPAMLPLLVERMKRLPRRVWRLKGGGAAGGLAAGLASVGATLVAGSSYILDRLRFRERTRRASLVITGEGRFDRTSLGGKAVGAVIRASRAPVVVICGDSDLSARQAGVKEIIRLVDVDPDPIKQPRRAIRAALVKVAPLLGR